MKTLKFKNEIQFEIQTVHAHDNVWHLEGFFLGGRFENSRLLRVEPSDEWLKAITLQLPGVELREVQSAVGNMGRNNFHRPIYTGKLYVMPMEAELFRYQDVKVVRSRFIDHRADKVKTAGLPAKVPVADTRRIDQMVQTWSVIQSERGSLKGREFEARVSRILERLKTEGLITSFVYHAPNSEEDLLGHDFTVTKNVSGALITRHFGVTVSNESYDHHVKTYPDVPQLLAACHLSDIKIEDFIFGIFGSNRRGEWDGQTHKEISLILTKLKQDGKITDFAYYGLGSHMADQGKNFAVNLMKDGLPIEICFGATSINEEFMEMKKTCPDVPQFFMRPGTAYRYFTLWLLDLIDKAR